MRQLLDFMSGSLASVTQLRFMQDPNKLDTFDDYKTYPWRVRDFHNNEASLFFKDDWKIQKNLTLNLGLRWDYFGVPYESHGLMAAASGGPDAIWGISGSGFPDWMKPGVRGTNTTSAYVGKNSPNSSTPWYENDYNNFGPAIGFAWQVPWFGARQDDPSRRISGDVPDWPVGQQYLPGTGRAWKYRQHHVQRATAASPISI